MQSVVAAQHSFFSSRGIRIAITVFAGIFSLCASALGQTGFTRIQGTEDQGIPTPAFVGTLGQKDAGALQALVDYLKAVNISGWQGMQASGTLTDSQGKTDQATLTIRPGDNFRLDVQTPGGERSTRISEGDGETLEASGKHSLMPPATAAAGPLAFPQLFSSTFPSSRTSLIDRGKVKIGGQTLHRITVEKIALPPATKMSRRNLSVTDLYFNPGTHLLVKSATALQLDPTDPERYLVVVTYGDYQKVRESLIPCLYSQSLNGQHQWSLQLNQPNLQPSVDPSYFHF